MKTFTTLQARRSTAPVSAESNTTAETHVHKKHLSAARTHARALKSPLSTLAQSSVEAMSGDGRAIATGLVASSVIMSVGLYFAFKAAAQNIREGFIGLSISVDNMTCVFPAVCTCDMCSPPSLRLAAPLPTRQARSPN